MNIFRHQYCNITIVHKNSVNKLQGYMLGYTGIIYRTFSSESNKNKKFTIVDSDSDQFSESTKLLIVTLLAQSMVDVLREVRKTKVVSAEDTQFLVNMAYALWYSVPENQKIWEEFLQARSDFYKIDFDKNISDYHQLDEKLKKVKDTWTKLNDLVLNLMNKSAFLIHCLGKHPCEMWTEKLKRFSLIYDLMIIFGRFLLQMFFIIFLVWVMIYLRSLIFDYN